MTKPTVVAVSIDPTLIPSSRHPFGDDALKELRTEIRGWILETFPEGMNNVYMTTESLRVRWNRSKLVMVNVHTENLHKQVQTMKLILDCVYGAAQNIDAVEVVNDHGNV